MVKNIFNQEQWSKLTNRKVFLLQHTNNIQDTCVITNVKATYAATDKEVIQAKEAPNLYASIPETNDIWKII